MKNEVIKFMVENKDRLMFIKLSTYTVYKALQDLEETIEKYHGYTYFAMIEELRSEYWKNNEPFESTEPDENTIVIFRPDNGGLFDSPPLSGIKSSLHEEGIRIPLIIS